MDPTQAATQNEDWPKVAAWDVTDEAGNPVTDLDGLAALLGMSRDDAAAELLGSPVVAGAPPALVAEAKAELSPDPQQASFDDVLGTDPQGGDPDQGGDGPAAPSGPADTGDDEDEAGDIGPGVTDDGDDDEAMYGKAFPWQKGGGKKGPSISAGTFVSGPFGKGKVEMVVSTGKVPNVDSDVEGTSSAPAARIRVWEESDGGWKATDKRVAAKVSSLKTTLPLDKIKKKSGAAALVLLTTEAVELPDEQRPTADALRTVYERGTRAWPGEAKTALSRDEWGLGRARAFLEKCQGIGIVGYVGDDDLLPD